MDAQTKKTRPISDMIGAPQLRRPVARDSGKPAVKRPQKYVSDIIGNAGVAGNETQYARFYRVAVSKSKPIVVSQPHHSLALQAVKDAKFIETPNPHTYSGPKKKRIGKSARRTANILVALAILMSGIMGVMVYRYHLALQKVEATPLNGQETPSDFADGTDTPSTSQLSEEKSFTGGASKLAPDTPYKLSIPKLKVSASIITVGTTKKGAINAPGNIWQVGWYKVSAKPAENTGVTVLNGHVHGPTKPGIFANLNRLQAGDIVTVKDVSGTSYSYKVVSKQTIKAGEAGDELMQSVSPTKQGLNIVTCTGEIEDDKYLDRLVVFTERI